MAIYKSKKIKYIYIYIINYYYYLPFLHTFFLLFTHLHWGFETPELPKTILNRVKCMFLMIKLLGLLKTQDLPKSFIDNKTFT